MKRRPALILIVIFAFLIIFILYLGIKNKKTPVVSSPTPTPIAVTSIPTQTAIANPASTNCVDKGGQLKIQTKPDGSQYGLCYFEENRACEEWALFRGECPVGGRKTTGYDTIAQNYCAWSGGQTSAVENAICTFSDGSTCPAKAFYADTCQKGTK